MEKRDIIILFGAGASYGAGGIIPEQPPLGDKLFSILAHQYPGSWGALPNPIKAAFSEHGFEIGMQKVHDNCGTSIPSLMREMALYFIQFRPHLNSSLYCKLIEDLNRIHVLQRTLFSTLNYECSLEFSVINHGFPLDYFDDQDSSAVPVWKLHGSCNMYSLGLQVGPGIAYGTGIAFEGGIKASLDTNEVVHHYLAETGLAPVMCLYMAGKPLSISPSGIREVQRRWSERVSTAQLIVCIGIRPVIDDEHIWNPLATSKAPLFYIGDETSFMEWQTNFARSNVQYLASRFNEGYDSLITTIEKYAPDRKR